MGTASSSSSKAAASSWIWPIVVALLAPVLYVFSIAPVGCMIGYYDVLAPKPGLEWFSTYTRPYGWVIDRVPDSWGRAMNDYNMWMIKQISPATAREYGY